LHRKRRRTYYKHDEAPHHFSQAAKHYLNQQFHYVWIGRGGEMNCPSRSPDLNLSYYHVCDYAKATAFAVNTKEYADSSTLQGA
jgi:hypothetical protein